MREARLDQTAPGVYETDLGVLTPGAYAMRFVQTQPGETPLARTVMLVAPTPAEYRLLGTNERLLAALRGATGGRAVEDGADAWKHDLGTTTAATDMLPWLLLLALLLWPLDVGGPARVQSRAAIWPLPAPGPARSLAGVARPGAADPSRSARCSPPPAAPVVPRRARP